MELDLTRAFNGGDSEPALCTGSQDRRRTLVCWGRRPWQEANEVSSFVGWKMEIFTPLLGKACSLAPHPSGLSEAGSDPRTPCPGLRRRIRLHFELLPRENLVRIPPLLLVSSTTNSLNSLNGEFSAQPQTRKILLESFWE